MAYLPVLSESLSATQKGNYLWYQAEGAQLISKTPFWQLRDLQRVVTSLREKGVLLVASAPLTESDQLKFAFNDHAQAPAMQTTSDAPQPLRKERVRHTATNIGPATEINPQQATSIHRPPQPATQNSRNNYQEHSQFLGKNIISPHWQPDQDTYAQLSQHGIPSNFANEQIPEFVTFWREKGDAHYSWGAKFLTHVLRKWRQFEAQQTRKSNQVEIQSNWLPSRDAMEILVRQAGIPQHFIEDAIPEFILYWGERGEKHSTWNSKFIQHIRIQWKKFNSTLESHSDPKPISATWQPSPDVFDVLQLANIDLGFANNLVGEFVLYWRDSGQIHTSWNTRFLQYVKRQWARQHQLPANTTNNLRNDPNGRSTRDISLEEELTDRSWANE